MLLHHYCNFRASGMSDIVYDVGLVSCN
jgi:hypothetical protein